MSWKRGKGAEWRGHGRRRCRTERRTVSYHVLNDFADYDDDVDALEKEGRVPGRPYMLLEQKLRAQIAWYGLQARSRSIGLRNTLLILFDGSAEQKPVCDIEILQIFLI